MAIRNSCSQRSRSPIVLMRVESFDYYKRRGALTACAKYTHQKSLQEKDRVVRNAFWQSNQDPQGKSTFCLCARESAISPL